MNPTDSGGVSTGTRRLPCNANREFKILTKYLSDSLYLQQTLILHFITRHKAGSLFTTLSAKQMEKVTISLSSFQLATERLRSIVLRVAHHQKTAASLLRFIFTAKYLKESFTKHESTKLSRHLIFKTVACAQVSASNTVCTPALESLSLCPASNARGLGGGRRRGLPAGRITSLKVRAAAPSGQTEVKTRHRDRQHWLRPPG